MTRRLPYLRDARFTRLLGLSRNVNSPQRPFFSIRNTVWEGTRQDQFKLEKRFNAYLSIYVYENIAEKTKKKKK